MRNRIRWIGLALLLGATISFAQDKAPATGAPGSAPGKKEQKTAPPVKLVDINSASKAELKKLPWIGDAEADKIIAGRPYTSKADLATRKIIPEGVYVQIKARIIARPKPEPAAKASGKKS